MALYASIGASRVVTLAMTMGTFGTWVADCALADATDVGTSVTLTVANLNLEATVFRQSAFAGVRTVRVIGGAAGWRKQLAPRAYQNPAGVPKAMVLKDAAIEVGESLANTPSGNVGVDWAREAGPASRLLKQVVGRAWWVDPAGKTHFGPRPSTSITSAFQVVSYDGARGILRIATEDVASWLPGAKFSNATVPQAQTISSVSIHADKGGKLRLDVLAVSP